MSYNGHYNGRQNGPSGKPEHHYIHCKSRADAEERAKNDGHGKPEHNSAHEPGQLPHFHPVDRNGNRIENGTHYTYPQNTKFWPK